LSVLQHHKYKMGLVSCANEQDLQHIVPDRFWNGLILPTDIEHNNGEWGYFNCQVSFYDMLIET